MDIEALTIDISMFNQIADLINSILFIFVDLLKSWSFVVLLIIFIFRKQLTEFLNDITSLNVTKNGIELKKTIKEAKETLIDLKELACSMYIPLIDLIANMGRWSGNISIEERLLNRKAIEKFIEKNKITDQKLSKKIEGLNNSIIFDVLDSMIENLNGTDKVGVFSEIHKLFNTKNVDVEYFECNPDLKAIENKLKENNLFDDSVSYIFDEAKYFIENKEFKDLNKLKEHMEIKKKQW